MAVSSDSSSCIESDSNSILSGLVNYSMEYSDDDSISDLSISPETEVLPYCFKPKVSDSESPGHSGNVHPGKLDGLSSERVRNINW